MGDTETNKGVDSSSPYYLHPSSNTDRIISPVVLRGNNYNEWARSVRNALKANNKLGFIDGSIQPPKPTESTMYSPWVQVNSMLGAWLHNTLDASIRSTVPITDDVGDMWEDIRQRFSVGNGPRIHELTSQLTRLEQGGDSVVDYYGKIRMIWDELACYSAPVCTCSCKCGAKGALVKEREDQKVHQFLIGLDSSIHGTVRSQILMQEPLTPLNTAFSKALTEERHHSIVHQGDKKAEAVGFAVQSSARGRGATPTKEGDKSRFTGTCSHCKKVEHDKDNCFQLLGFPDWWYSENRAAARGGGKYTRGGRGNGRGRGNVANAVGQSSGSTSGQQIGAPDRNGVQLSDAQWHHLLGMLKPSQPNDATPTHDGKYKATQWIIDTGCSNHMTGNISLFESLYDVSPSPVGLPNGNHTTAIKEGKIVLSDGLILKDVLYVPDLNVNLISVSQLLATLNYFITVTDKLCIIQDSNSRTLIGAGEQCDGVYWFKPTKRIQTNQTTVVGQQELWHRRLGHPSRKVVSLLPFISCNKAYSASNDFCDSKEPCVGINELFHRQPQIVVDENDGDSGVRGSCEGHEVEEDGHITTLLDQQSPQPGCGHRIRTPSTRLKGYITNTIQTITPVIVTSSSPPKRSSAFCDGIVDSLQHHSHVPKFGSWDRDNKRYTTEFENARKAKAAEKMNPNDPEAIANGTGGQEDSIQDPPNVDTDSKISTEKQCEGEGNLGHNQQGRNTYNCQKSETKGVGSMQDPLNVDSESKNFTEKQQSEGNVSNKSTLSEIASDKSNSDCSPRQSVELSLKSDRKKVTGEESNSFSLSVQGHYRQRSGIYTSDESQLNSDYTLKFNGWQQHRRASVPKFGDWDEMDPASGEGFTVIFDKLKEEKQIATANFLPVTAQASTCFAVYVQAEVTDIDNKAS
ncbi:hypothetical protein JRO89_XS06G0157600 [Xanthoceras sorbifolium]|uniref:Retrotransposon Copia-like N-terminal domain-containing protein n=1 Tax=Xanthoceras sorbifolium TaxID=99658 RepID=A0ABQ8HYJ0_9ROSI|nr:hypothetical protein JRO89_XS06G0157600 [Xanthoceras sorbifolium]